jgi:AbrB family looped-hinge helix DNA binding protein
MQRVRAKVAAGGRIVIPAEFRRALGVRTGDTVILQLDDGDVRVFTLDRAIKRAQELLDRYIPGDRCLSEELIAERRAEAARE